MPSKLEQGISMLSILTRPITKFVTQMSQLGVSILGSTGHYICKENRRN